MSEVVVIGPGPAGVLAAGLPHASAARRVYSSALGCTAGIPNCRPTAVRA